MEEFKMKKRIFALPIVLSSALLLGACGDDDDADINDIEVEDPTLEDDGQNDSGLDSENEGEVDTQDDQDSTTGTDGTDDTTGAENSETEGTETEAVPDSSTEAK